MKTKLAVAAQSFGYGPCSKLSTILDFLNPNATFYGNTTSLTFAKLNKEVFRKIVKMQGKDYFQIPFAQYSYSIAVMDYDFAIAAWWNNNKYIYVDSLFWFWDWSKINLDSIKLLDNLKEKGDLTEFLKIWNNIDPHSKQYFAHFYSTRSVIQKYANNTEHTKLFPNKRFVEVGPIINNSLKKIATRTKIVVSYCGLLSPLVNKQKALEYIELTKKLLEIFLPKNKKNILFLVNPELRQECKKILPFGKVYSLGHKSTLKLLNKTKALILPPSITSILEASEYGVPIILLPEEHDGHYPNYLELKRKANGKNHFDGFIIQELLSKQIFKGNEKEQTTKIHAYLNNIELNKHPEWKQKANYLRRLLKNENELHKLAELQRQSLNLLSQDNIINHLHELRL